MKVKLFARAACALVIVSLVGCATHDTKVDNSAGRATVYNAPGTVGPVQGVGIESQDIVSMSDRMMRSMLANPMLVQRGSKGSPRIIVDAEYFKNESSSRINKNIITDRLRIGLNQAANGRMLFVARHLSSMVEKERALKRKGKVDGGTIRKTRATAGADFRLGGRITSLDAIDKQTHLKSRFHQITFEMVDLEYGTVVWSGIYEFKKSSQANIMYR